MDKFTIDSVPADFPREDKRKIAYSIVRAVARQPLFAQNLSSIELMRRSMDVTGPLQIELDALDDEALYERSRAAQRA